LYHPDAVPEEHIKYEVENFVKPSTTGAVVGVREKIMREASPTTCVRINS